MTMETLRRWMYRRSKESHLFPLTHSVKWIEAEPFDLAFTLPFSPCRVHSAPTITANREGDGLKILSWYRSQDPISPVDTIKPSLRARKCWRGNNTEGLSIKALPPSSCLKPSATENPPASLYLILKSATEDWWILSMEEIFTTYCLIRCKQGIAKAHILGLD